MESLAFREHRKEIKTHLMDHSSIADLNTDFKCSFDFMINSYKKLRVWKKACELSILVYNVTARFPNSELYGLTSQIRRSSVSVSANIAESTGKYGAKEKARYVAIAYGSLMEMLSLLNLSLDLGFVSKMKLVEIESISEDIAKMLSGMRKSYLNELEFR